MPTETTRTVKRTERGWAGHFCLSYDCLFRRNTLLECGNERIVVSTVGDCIEGDRAVPILGVDVYYETRVFVAIYEDPYWEADVFKPIQHNCPWTLNKSTREADFDANLMHEYIVDEMTHLMEKAEIRYESEAI